MAAVTKTFMVDDIDGSHDDVSTVQIALDSVSYEIDLSADNAARLDRKAKRGRAGTSAPVGREQALVDNGKKVTASFSRNGYAVSSGDAFPRVCRRRSITRTE